MASLSLEEIQRSKLVQAPVTLAHPGEQLFRNGLTHGALNYGDYTAIRLAVLL